MAAKEAHLSEATRQKALQTSIKEGSAEGIAASMGGSYITPLAEALHATPAHISFLNALPGLLAPLAQVAGAKLMERTSRKKIVLLFAFLQMLMWIPIALLAYLAFTNTLTLHAPLFLIIAYTLVTILGSVAYPAWFSWIGDLVPEHERGRYFSIRSRTIGVVALVAA